MKTVKAKIKDKILASNNYDKIWSSNDFLNLPKINVLKAFSDLTKEGIIKRAQRGFYFRSKKTVLGETNCSEINLAISKAKNKGKFYCITGIAGYNELGFTTQIPNHIVIACDVNLRSNENVKYIHRNKPINGGNTERIVLDAIIDIKIIPNTTVEKTILKIKKLIEKQKVNLTSLVKSAFYESPRVKSVIGAIAEEFNFDKQILNKLKNTINPLSMIYLNTGSALIYANNWQIKPEK